MKILIVAHAFPPHNASGSVRVGKLAEYLCEQGHDVRVITAEPLPYPRTLTTTVAPERVIATPWFDPVAILKKLRRPDAAADTAKADGDSGGAYRRWLAAALGIPDLQIGWYLYAIRAGRSLFRHWQPDIIYASALPFTGHMVARRLSRLAGVPWVAEFRDQFADNPYSNLPAWRAPLDRWIERRVLATAAACVTVSDPIAEYLSRQHGKRTLVALNGYDERDYPADAPRTPDRHAPVTILYTGNIYPGRRDPSALFAAIAGLGAEANSVQVIFHGDDLRGVAALAERHGVSKNVTVLPSIPYRRSLAEQRAADVLLLLLWNDPREAGVYTGKLFEYIGAGRPILSVGAERGKAAELLQSRSLGLASASPERIGAALRAWIAEKRANGAIAGPPGESRRGLSRQDQFAAVGSLLHDLVRARIPAGAPHEAPSATLPGHS
ncbi:MAG TPA: glycosyltransferase family 4 protein [Candidatus Cybelea sp.]|nr:glycosyltransferase family 4 protein [Candidatus Cybelea sp.]